ncbi:uncharacterized protein DSM5745_03615 [Aspergillus mulundensis]|uniref:Uncharacterized protein n=1 Tax=Aspergillus mulundensis TaxID=1810919 RepID=A0A3D8SKY9_9EURO|nr:hypothetical protein DSM5745_03615 [Aspergillus mulundensis]RDW86973.1 hypothetical protein DSM5745_03615 [Aspergillus mulundensis]
MDDAFHGLDARIAEVAEKFWCRWKYCFGDRLVDPVAIKLAKAPLVLDVTTLHNIQAHKPPIRPPRSSQNASPKEWRKVGLYISRTPCLFTPWLIEAVSVDVARLLDQAGIPNVLWGWLALALAASDQGNHEVQFVIADDKVDDAKKVLAAAGFTACTHPKCFELSDDRFPEDQWRDIFLNGTPEQRSAVAIASMAFDRYHPVAAVHYHTEKQSDEYRLLSLYKKSAQLWWLPTMNVGPPAKDDRNLTTSDSNRLPTGKNRTGPWTGQYPIQVLTPWALLEGLIFLFCRDFGHLQEMDQKLWFGMILFFMPHDDEVRYKIGPRFVDAWGAVKSRIPEGMNQFVPFFKLRSELILAGELPDIPPNKAHMFE